MFFLSEASCFGFSKLKTNLNEEKKLAFPFRGASIILTLSSIYGIRHLPNSQSLSRPERPARWRPPSVVSDRCLASPHPVMTMFDYRPAATPRPPYKMSRTPPRGHRAGPAP